MGSNFACFLRADGQVACWGNDGDAQLGTVGSRALRWTLVSRVIGVTQLVAGDTHVCGLQGGGHVICWGGDNFGQLGDGHSGTGAIGLPTVIMGLASVVEVAAGLHHTCARLSSGGVSCWGANNYGQIGSASSGSSNVPVTVDTSSMGPAHGLAAGGNFSCALDADGHAYC